MKNSIHLLLLVFTFVLISTCPAAITITGVSDEQIYADSVSFTIVSQAGYDYTATLNGIAVDVDTLIEVDAPEYYELAVSREEIASGTVESTLIQFIVRASERLDTEWGLPVFTPYPMIDSAAGEFSDAQLEIVTPASFPMGLEIPLIARIQDATEKRLGINGFVTATGFESSGLQLFRGVGSVFLPAATEAGMISYTGQIQTLSTPKQINIEASTTWQTVSGTIGISTDWGTDARVQITGNLSIPANVTLTIGAGSVIVVAPDVEITVDGHIITNGTNENPIVFTAQDRSQPWGGFIMESATSQGDFSGTIFTASGADPSWFSGKDYFTHQNEQCLFLLSNDGHATLTDCYMIENAGQIGHGEHGYLAMNGCLVQKAVTVGQYNNGSVNFQDTALIEFPPVRDAFIDDDNDCIYLSGGPHTFTDCLFGWTLDDGIDAGQGDEGSVTFDGCWFESCIHEAMALSSGPRYATIIDSVAINCGQGIECGYGSPFIEATNCFSTANVVGARFGDNYDRTFSGFLDVKDSLLLYNHRDVWGMNWDDWTERLLQMDIQNNYLSVENPTYPNNMLWDPDSDANQLDMLAFFVPTDAATVGVGIATQENLFDFSKLNTSNQIPVRLSTFTTNAVSVDYTIYTNLGMLKNGTLDFVPGESVKHIEFHIILTEEIRQVRIVLSNPVHAEITNYSQIIFEKPYEIAEQLVEVGDMWKYFKGTSEPPVDWNQQTFDDSGWLEGVSGFGYETGSGYENCIATNLSDMKDNYFSIYARILFWIEDPARLTELEFAMQWDDGYIAYINGVQIDSQYPPETVAYDEPAGSDAHEACCGAGCNPRRVDLTSFIDELTPGFNVLAVQAHNGTLGSSDFLFIPSLSSVTAPHAGDFEPDGDVDLKDFAIFARTWLSQDGQAEFNAVCDIDLTSDGQINLDDLSVFVENWLAGK